MPSDPPKLTLVIPTLNRDDRLRETIDSLLQQTFQEWELLVIDQSRDPRPTARWIVELGDPRIRHQTMQPPSLTKSRNLATSLATADLIVFIDDDVELHPGFLEGYLDAFADPTVQAVAGRVVQENFPVSPHPLIISVGGVGTGTFDCPTDQDAMTAQGCNMGFRKSALLAAGGFDTRFAKNAYREESDLCFRLRRLGHRIVYRQKAALTHIPDRAGGCRPAGSKKLHQVVKYRNESLFFLKHWPLWQAPLFAWRHLSHVVWKRKLPKKPHELAQMLYLPAGFVIGLWVWLTSKPAGVPGKE